MRLKRRLIDKGLTTRSRTKTRGRRQDAGLRSPNKAGRPAATRGNATKHLVLGSGRRTILLRCRPHRVDRPTGTLQGRLESRTLRTHTQEPEAVNLTAGQLERVTVEMEATETAEMEAVDLARTGTRLTLNKEPSRLMIRLC